MKLISYCIYIYIFFKPFYIVKSGNLQISDLFIVFAFFLMMLLRLRKKENNDMLYKVKPLLVFTVLACSINFIYFLIYETKDFVMSSLQYVFITMGVYVFYNIINQRRLILNIKKVLKIDIVIQLIIYIIGFGKYFGGSRYMGTFNDPNQFAFFIFLSLMLITTINNINRKKEKLNFLYFFVSLYLIIQSASTGIMLGMIVFIILKICANFKEYIQKLKKYTTKIFLITLIVVVIVGILLTLYWVDNTFKYKVDNKVIGTLNSLYFKRLREKVNKFEQDNKENSFIEDRCLDKIIIYPEYVLFGAGQGNYMRFEKTYSYNEIHSTLPSILFYYGIIPFIILLYWIYINMKGLKFRQYIPYIAILVESFTLLNQRQLLLWFFIILANVYKIGKEDKKNAKDINYNGNI